MKKFRILLSSILMIALCVSLVASGTFALFSSEGKTNIAVSSGQVSIFASAEIVEAWSTDWDKDANSYVKNTDIDQIPNGYQFTNQGTAVFDGKELTINNITPGDGLKLNINMLNKSSVKTKYRIEVTETVPDSGLLYGMDVSYTMGDAAAAFEGHNPKYTGWMDLDEAKDVKNGDLIQAIQLEIELPQSAGDEYQDMVSKLAITVYAVQANGSVDAPEQIPEPQTVTTTVFDYAKQNDWNATDRYDKIELDQFVTLSTNVTDGGNNGTYDAENSSWNLHEDEDATVTISVPDNFKLISFAITYDNGALHATDSVTPLARAGFSGELLSGATYAVADGVNEVTLTVQGVVQITDVKVVYSEVMDTTACDHVWDEEHIVWTWADDYKSATATITCANDETHTHTAKAAVKHGNNTATCTEGGAIEHTATVTFTDIGTYTNVAMETTAALGHDLRDVEGQPATCTEDGFTAYQECSRCDHTEGYYVIEATGHDYKGAWYNDGNGGHYQKCANDESHHSNSVAHNMGDFVNHASTCTDCGYVDSHQATWEVVAHADATCTADGYTTYKCKYCEETYTDTISATGHSWDNGVVTTDPTCEVAGVKTYTCSACDATKTEAIAATGHSYDDVWHHDASGHWHECTKCGSKDEVRNHTEEVVEGYDATCTEDGLTDGAKCSVCNEVIKAQETIAATGHSYGDGVVTTPATCTTDGTRTYTCSACGAIKTETIAATGHSYEDFAEKPATCEEDGYTAHKVCSVCGDKVGYAVLNKTGHDYTNVTPTWSWANDYTSATATFKCNNCNHTEDVAATSITTETTAAADCTNDRKYHYLATASFNGQDYTVYSDELTEENSALGHNYTIYVESTQDKHTLMCSTCNIATQEFDHTYEENPLLSDETYHKYICSVDGCDGTKLEAHSWDNGKVTESATCDKDGVFTYTCDDCGETKTEAIEATGHSWDNGVVTIPATCTTDGTLTYTCSTCGAAYTTTIAAIGHEYEFTTWNWADDCSSAEALFTCANDSTHTTTAPATVETTHTDPTCEADGYYTHNASVTFEGKSYSDTKTSAGESKTGHSLEWKYDDDEHYQYCAICGYATEKAAHSWDNGVVTTDPTCEDAGETTYKCLDCGATKTEAIAATGHSYDDVWHHDASGHWHECTKCGGKDEVRNHTEEVVEGYAATCTESGLTNGAKCSVCNEVTKAQETIAATGHTNTDVAAKAATCMESGHTAYQICSVCQTKQGYQEFPALGHDLHDVEGVAATCTESGHTAYKECLRCDHTEGYETTKALGHDNVTIQGKDATCTEDGHTEYTVCVRCGDKGGYVVLNKTAHSYGNWIDATVGENCQTAGTVGHYECSECHNWFDTDYKEIDEDNRAAEYGEHNYEGQHWIVVEDSHYQECKHCQEKGNIGKCDIEGIEFDSDKHWFVCSVCGNDFDKVLAEDHNLYWAHDDKEDLTGFHQQLCKDCGYKTVTSDHNFVWETKDLYNDCCFGECECGAIYMLAHQWDEGKTVDATCTTDGTRTYTCSVCHGTKTDIISKNEHRFNTLASDNDNHWLECDNCGAIQESSVVAHDFNEYNSNDERTHNAHCNICDANIEQGHDFGYTDNKDGDTHKKYCEACDYSVNEDHSYADGSDTCEHCDYTKPANEEIWDLVTDASVLKEGSVIILVYDTNALGKDSGTTTRYRLRVAEAISTNDDGSIKINKPADVVKIELKASDDGAWALSTDEGYLYWSANNTLLSSDSISDEKNNAWWKITIDDATSGAAKIINQQDTTRLLQYNSTKNQERFATYATSQKYPSIYILRGTGQTPCTHEDTIEYVPQQDPTCTETGLAAHWICTKCQKTFVDDQGTEGKPEVLDALGHTLPTDSTEYTCNQEDGTHSYKCERCGEDVTGKHEYEQDADTNYTTADDCHFTQCAICKLYVEHTTKFAINNEGGHDLSCETCSWTAHEEHDDNGDDGACSKCGFNHNGGEDEPGVPVVIATALFGPDYNSQKISSYTDTWTVTVNDFTCEIANFNNNNNGWNYIKAGRKGNASIATITTESPIAAKITSVVLTIDAVTASSINSITLKTSASADFTNSTVQSFENIAKGDNTVTFEPPAEKLYYQIVFDCASDSSNGIIQISKVEYWGYKASTGGGDDVCEHVYTDKYEANDDGQTHSLVCDKCGEKQSETSAHAPQYIDNNDGETHKIICKECKYVMGETELHDYEHGDAANTCKCGAQKAEEQPEQPSGSQLLATFTMGNDGGTAQHVDGSTGTYTNTVGSYSISVSGTNFYTGATDAKGNGCVKLGTSSKAGTLTFTVSASDVTTVKIYVAKYKTKDAKVKVNGAETETTLTKNSDDGEYDVIIVDVSLEKTVTLEVTNGYRAMVNTIEFWS